MKRLLHRLQAACPADTFILIDIEDADELIRYLRQTGRIDPDETPGLRALPGGVSNKTILLQRQDGARWVLKQALPKLRVQTEWFSDPARIQVEANALRYLPRLTPPNSTPALLFEDQRQHLLAMEAVPEPHENWKERLLKGLVDCDLVRQFGRLLATLHRTSHELRQELAPIFRSRIFFETLRLEPYYRFSAEAVPEAKAFLLALLADVRKRRVSLVHGDYSPKNVLVHGRRLVLLDHEVLHFGDPAFDVGFSLTHLLSKALHLPEHRAPLLGAALEHWGTYAAQLDLVPWFEGIECRAARHTAACLLARTAGRSPLEYLSAEERARQRDAALQLITCCPATVPDLIDRFGQEIVRR
ncbi:MAG: phosphotransferase [Verrucomicrobia bacterium]|nr:phosphotransferase [Verrucomicrobiota bacterium]